MNAEQLGTFGRPRHWDCEKCQRHLSHIDGDDFALNLLDSINAGELATLNLLKATDDAGGAL